MEVDFWKNFVSVCLFRTKIQVLCKLEQTRLFSHNLSYDGNTIKELMRLRPALGIQN